MTMTFKDLVPKRRTGYSGDKLTIRFPIIQGRQHVVIIFGRDIAEKIGISDGEKARIAIEETNSLIWLLKKIDQNVSGWKVIDINKKNTRDPVYKMQLAWDGDVPAAFRDKKKKYIKHDVYTGGIRMFLPGADNVEKDLE